MSDIFDDIEKKKEEAVIDDNSLSNSKDELEEYISELEERSDSDNEVISEKVEKVEEDKNNSPEKVLNSTGEEDKGSLIVRTLGYMAAAVFVIAMIVSIATALRNNEKNTTKASAISITQAPSTTTKESKSKGESSGNISSLTTSNVDNDGESVADVVENVMPAIVKINCTVVSTTMDFFGRSYEEEAEGSGSGIIIGQNDSQILVATNNHVVDDAKTVKVVFCDESEVDAEVKGTDSYADLAVVAIKTSKVNKETLAKIKIASLGNSDDAKVGQMAIAIGNALGYGQSVTVGVISALDRSIDVEDSSMSLIQTDAAINPGNSGGALINAKGEVIGINSVKYVSEDTEGMGYAIPISKAIPIINELMNYEEIADSEKGYLGIKGQDIDEESAKRYNAVPGIAVSKVSEGSPADEAGLLRGDIITKFDGRDVKTMQQLQELLSKRKAGYTCEIVINRRSGEEYKEKTIEVTLGARADYEQR
ncbi:MAG: trypsin-like peptidase domain-containing protein [Lachnospiraceae bacterium]|nr:trypsin-like peptidase domain-containing protein [Lachnospiraceae bacterium]